MSDVPAKRSKTEAEVDEVVGEVPPAKSIVESDAKSPTSDDLKLLSTVDEIHVLSESGLSKTCVFSAHVKSGDTADASAASEDGDKKDNALFIVERTPIDGDEVRTLLSLARGGDQSLLCVNQFTNDAYSSSFLYQPIAVNSSSSSNENGEAKGTVGAMGDAENGSNGTENGSSDKHTEKAKVKHHFNAIKLTRIFPAEKTHFDKYSASDHRLVHETYEDYEAATLPLGLRKFKSDWIVNILEGRSEQERVIHSDADENLGYVVIPDMKCVLPDEVRANPSNARNLYALAIARRRDLRTLRDLDGNDASHMQLLTRIQNDAVDAVARRYGITRDVLVAFVHYPPSFYHLHVHIVHVGNERLNAATVGRGMHVLETVISNLQHFPDYYRKVTLTICLKTNDQLFIGLKERAEKKPETAVEVVTNAEVEAK